MPYTINVGDRPTAQRFVEALTKKLVADARFSVGRLDTVESVKRGVSTFEVHPGMIRLTKAKAYCGQHPGPCPVDSRPKPRRRFLEWADWVAFNDLVNDVLDALGASADVWSVPHRARTEPAMRGHGRRFFTRRGYKRRLRWDWEEEPNPRGGRPIRRWDMGSPSQFAA